MSQTQTYRPVLDDDDIALIVTAVALSVDDYLTRAEKSNDPEVALGAVRYRSRAVGLNDRLLRLQERAWAPKSTEVPGQVSMEDILAAEDAGPDGIIAQPVEDPGLSKLDEFVATMVERQPDGSLDISTIRVEGVNAIRVEEPSVESFV